MTTTTNRGTINNDKIVYVLVAEGGGVDGRDFNDRGGDIIGASFEKTDFHGHKNRAWAKVKTKVVDVEVQRRVAVSKLDALDKLVLGLS
jgi:hypothetical protein